MNPMNQLLARIKRPTFAMCTIACLSLVTLSGCDISFLTDGIRGSGVSKSESRDVSTFDQIELDGVGTVNVEFGDTPSLKVTGDDNLLEYVQTETEGGVLKICQKENINPVVDLTFDIVTNNLTGVEVDGAGKLKIRSAKLGDLKLVVDGAGAVTADGTAANLDIDVSGAAKIDANALQAKSVKISISGAGKADVYASESLDAVISGAGLVNCLGKPSQVTRNVSGAGRINISE